MANPTLNLLTSSKLKKGESAGGNLGKTAALLLAPTPFGKVKAGKAILSGLSKIAPKLGSALKGVAGKIFSKGVQKGGQALDFAISNPVKASVNALQITGLTAVVAGGGAKLVPPAFKKVKGATERVVEATIGDKDGTKDVDIKDALVVGGSAVGLGALGYLATKVLGGDDEKTPESPEIPKETTKDITAPMPEEIPVVPQTETIEAGETPKKKKKSSRRASKRLPERINQSVRIVFDNDRIDRKIYKGGSR